MDKFITINDSVHDANDCFIQVNIGDKVNPWCGCREISISVSDIAHLIRGGCLYTNDGEYATIIALQRNSFNPNRDKNPDFTDHTGQGDYTN